MTFHSKHALLDVETKVQDQAVVAETGCDRTHVWSSAQHDEEVKRSLLELECSSVV